MNCAQMEKHLIAYLDGKAASSGRRQMESHLAECVSCRQRAEEFRLLWGVLDELPVVSPSPSFDAAVRARVAQEPARVSFWKWVVPSPRLAFAATALVVLSVWFSSLAPKSPSVQIAPQITAQTNDAEFKVIENLPVLENYDVLANFDALSALPVQPAAPAQPRRRQM